MRYVKIAEHYKVEAVERLREVSRTADARSGEEAGDRESFEFSHSAGERALRDARKLKKRLVGAPGFEPGASCAKAGALPGWLRPT